MRGPCPGGRGRRVARLNPSRVPLDFAGTPFSALRALRDLPRPFALVGEWAGGGAIVGAAPARVASGFEPLPALPVSDVVGGGWFGRIGFPLGGSIEDVGPPPPRPLPVPTVGTGFYEWVLRLDATGAWWFETLGSLDALEAVRARLERGGVPRAFALRDAGVRAPGWEGHRRGVAEAVECIRAGEIFQVNLCTRIEATLDGSLLDLWCAVASEVTPRFGAYFDGVASLSPELFLRRRGRVVETEPIKGTAPRDEPGAREALEASAKDAAEHVMIVDLMRNDLGRVCAYGSVVADRAPRVEAHPGVWHLVSTVRGTLRGDVDDAALLRACFPPGSVTGAPKVQAVKVLHRLEATGRETYTGAIGFASPAWGTELNVAIRTFEAAGASVWMGAGGGIVADSDPAAEAVEAWRKAAPLFAAAGCTLPPPDRRPPAPRLSRSAGPPILEWRPDPRRGLLETIKVSDGLAVRAEAHLARLARSARAVGLPEPPSSLIEDLAAAASDVGEGHLRIVHRPSATTIETGPPRDPEPVELVPWTLPGGLGEHKWLDRAGLPPDALLVDIDGCVLEGAWASVVIAEDGELVTPPHDGRVLPGLTVRELEGVRFEPISLERLEAAGEVFLLSSVRGRTPARLQRAPAQSL